MGVQHSRETNSMRRKNGEQKNGENKSSKRKWKRSSSKTVNIEEVENIPCYPKEKWTRRSNEILSRSFDSLTRKEKEIRRFSLPEKSILKKYSAFEGNAPKVEQSMPVIMVTDCTDSDEIEQVNVAYLQRSRSAGDIVRRTKLSHSFSSPAVCQKKRSSVTFKEDCVESIDLSRNRSMSSSCKRSTIKVPVEEKMRSSSDSCIQSDIFNYTVKKQSRKSEKNNRHKRCNSVPVTLKSRNRIKNELRNRSGSNMFYEKPPIPGSLQKKLNFEKERHRRNSYSKPLSDEFDLSLYVNKSSPLRIPLNSTVAVKLLPQFSRAGENDMKHVLYICIKRSPKRKFERTGHFFQADVRFIEGTMKYFKDSKSSTTTRRLVRAHTWLGTSQFLEYTHDKLSIVGNFRTQEKGLLAYLEFELVLHPNYRGIISADNNETLQAVGMFQFRDARQIINERVFRWKAAVEDKFDYSLFSKHKQTNKQKSNRDNTYLRSDDIIENKTVKPEKEEGPLENKIDHLNDEEEDFML